MTRIEADALLGAPPPDVWVRLLDQARWRVWFLPPPAAAGDAVDGAGHGEGDGTAGGGGGLRLDAVTLVSGAPDRVGTERVCRATLGPLPLPLPLPGARGARVLHWTDRIAEVHAPWLLELDFVGAPPPFGRARLRLILVEGPPGQTRLRLRLTYAPGAYRLLDALWLRRELAAGLRRALSGLHDRYPTAPAVTAPAQPAAPAPTGHIRAAV